MKQMFVLFLLSSFISTAAQNDMLKKGIKWTHGLSWQQIKARAKAENKFIFLDAYATWCGPCKLMDERVYPLKEAGDVLNNDFISIKVQFDQTANDDSYTRSWYQDAKALSQQYSIDGFPAFLFFSPQGELVHRGLGYQGVGDFVKMVQFAVDPKRKEYYALMDSYKSGRKDYLILPDLIKTTKEVIRDNDLAAKMAKDYKENYLDKLNEVEAYTRANLDFMGEYYTLFNSKDKFFQLCYEQPHKAEAIKGWERTDVSWAAVQVNQTITREEIENKVLKHGKPVTKNPNWKKITSVIKGKYSKINAGKLVLDFQINYYYHYAKDWRKWAYYKDISIKNNPPSPGMQSFMELNMPAWNTFLHCNDRTVLEKALEWSDMSIKIQAHNPEDALQDLDTRANLLYKLGRKEEAIEQEEAALMLSKKIGKKNGRQKGPFEDEYETVLIKMRQGKPTWPTK